MDGSGVVFTRRRSYAHQRKMPSVPSSFRSPALLRNGHVQTILGALIHRRLDVPFERETLEVPDGDFLGLSWLRTGRDRLAIVSSGLEGDADDRHVRGMAATLRSAGWDVLAWNFRGCGSAPNRLLRFYHSGETGDLGRVIAHAAGHYSRIALMGFSLGGNLILKYLGEAKPHPAVFAASAVSAPVDLASSARALDRRWFNGIYLRRLIKSLVRKIEAKALRFPAQLDVRGARGIRTFEEFDGRYTAPLHGFRDAQDYWAQSSSRQYLQRIAVPTLLLNARNDPFLTPQCFPSPEAKASSRLFLEVPDSGGHVGFLDFRNGLQPWYERRVVEFLGQYSDFAGS